MPNCFNDVLYKFDREVDSGIVQKGLTAEEANKYYLNENYETYLVEYTGDFLGRLNAIDYAEAYSPGLFFAILFVKKGMLSDLLKEFPEITNIERSYPFTLFRLDESRELADSKAISKGASPLDGEGVIVGIIGTGIDYLNPRFMDKNGKSRIISIWDQSINDGPIPETFINGTEYTRDDINKAKAANTLGNNPYEIVKHKDEVGYGTAIANIVGGSKLSEKDQLEGIAPKCEFVIVKLKESNMLNKEHWGIEDYKGLVYDSGDIGSSGRYIFKMQQKFNKPTVMLMTVGTNIGAHDGSTIGERYVNYFTQGRMFSVVTSTGDQGASPICLKASFMPDENEKVVEINVDENQRNLFLILYYSEPDIISIGITSPSGETINKIPINPINGMELSATLGESTIFVQYFLETKETGNQSISFIMRNAEAGIWKINVMRDEVINGTFNIWLQQNEFSVGKTGLVNNTPYTTLMTPSTANNIIATSSFDQINNMIMDESGRGFTIDNRTIPSIAIASRNIATVGLNNKPIVVSGTAVSGAILAAVVALIYQWGIVQKNDITLYPVKIKSYLIQGTVREKDKIYPNPEVGYGLLNIKYLLEKLHKRKNIDSDEEPVIISRCSENPSASNMIFVSIPKDIYLRIK